MANEQYANTNPEDIYAQLTPEQRSAIAQQFISGMHGSTHPAAQQFAQVDPKTVTPKQLADMHKHARDENKNLFGKVLEHPVATAALGGFAIYEIEKHVREH